jgi:hypothetical protein
MIEPVLQVYVFEVCWQIPESLRMKTEESSVAGMPELVL